MCEPKPVPFRSSAKGVRALLDGLQSGSAVRRKVRRLLCMAYVP